MTTIDLRPRGSQRPAGRLRGAARCIGLVLGGWLVMAGAAQAIEFDALMAMLAQTRSGQARFTEQRWVSGLDAPLASSGTLSFTAPDRFTRQMLAPRSETLAVHGNSVSVSRNGRSRSLALDAAPEIEPIVEALRGTLTGNGRSLQQHFKTSVSGDAQSWQLTLAPIAPRLQALLAGVSITGQRAELRSVEMRMADGDRSLMLIEALPAAGR